MTACRRIAFRTRRNVSRLAGVMSLLLLASLVPAQIDEHLPQFKEGRTAHRSSSYDRAGGNFDARPIASGDTLTIADLTGPGCITHLWFTHLYTGRAGLRKLVIRAYFDGAETPCVEAPLGDFFGLGHAQVYAYASQPLAVATHGGLNSYWRMPFQKSARLTITNEGRQACQPLYFYVDYEKYDRPRPDQACFHAHYRQAMPCVKGEHYLLLEATGRGHYVGCNLSIEQGEESWWGEGDDRIYIDGETTPSIIGTGSEDYFGGAWCYWNEFAYPFIGMPFRGRHLEDGTLDRYAPDLKRSEAAHWHWPVAWRKGDLWNVYRYHIPDPIPFTKSIRVEIEHGYINNERQDHYSSVAYWYQSEPHAPQPALAKAEERLPMFLRLTDRGQGVYEAEEFADAAGTTSTVGVAADVESGFWGKLFSRGAVLEWNPDRQEGELTLQIPVPAAGKYDLSTTAVLNRRGGRFEVRVGDQVVTSSLELYEKGTYPLPHSLALGRFDLPAGTLPLRFRVTGKPEGSEAQQLTLDAIQLRKLE